MTKRTCHKKIQVKHQEPLVACCLQIIFSDTNHRAIIAANFNKNTFEADHLFASHRPPPSLPVCCRCMNTLVMKLSESQAEAVCRRHRDK